MVRHLHLDPLGGVAGDMFAAALLDAFPEHADAVAAAASAVSGVPVRVLSHRDAVLTGCRFDVAVSHHRHGDHHQHAHWRDIRAHIEASALKPGAQRHAIGIFTHLADAEARVHGISADDVAFHEVGAADSVADIAAAAVLIDALASASWSVGPLPLGGGTVRTQHGLLPVPAPATALLLEGFAVVDDGIAGERVTPTGAAILRHLDCIPRPTAGLRLQRSGHGFGTRTLPGMSNVLRVLAFSVEDAAASGTHRELAVIAFEVDDQSPEDLAAGLDRLRALPGVHDVVQMPAFGKKNRMAAHVQVLARPETLEGAIASCFSETTTIGLRIHAVQGRALPRRVETVAIDGAPVRVKRVQRPDGGTAKVEADDLAAAAGQSARDRLRRAAEALAEATDDD